MATGGKSRDAREARERARVYQARQQLHESQARRRRRDNLIAGIGGGLVLLAAIGGQVAYFATGPGAPEPTPSSSPAVTDPVVPTPSSEPTPAEPTPTVAP
ncbi:dioxygenase [Microbacterium sp. RD1]|uniref:dioxygenase n=1 Tax=Microbacterium sp. RD1 TaxID=3457313 RepID=UPI003FA5E8C9